MKKPNKRRPDRTQYRSESDSIGMVRVRGDSVRFSDEQMATLMVEHHTRAERAVAGFCGEWLI